MRELFRQKLENAEIVPDASVSSKLMRKLTRREFLRFNPVRFNIYYLGGILVAGITASLILFSGSDKSGESSPLILAGEISKTERTESINVSTEPTADRKSVNLTESPSEPIIEEVITRSKADFKNVPAQKRTPQDTLKVIRAGVNDSFSKKGLLTGSSADNNKLQGRSNPDELLFESSVKEGCTPLKIQF